MNAALSANMGKFPLAAIVPTPRRDFYGQALRRLCLLCPEQALVCSVRGRGRLNIEGSYGVRGGLVGLGVAAMERLGQVLRTGQPIWRTEDGWMVCLPVLNRHGKVGAILYGECGIPLLTHTDLDELVEWAQTVGSASLESSRHYGPLGQRQMAILLRSLATMVEAGVTLNRALFHLARTSGEPATAALCTALSNDVQRGIPLSQAASRHPAIFTSLHVGLLQVGEATGRLSLVLKRLAAYDEKRLTTSIKLRAALTYPAALLGLCLLGLLLAPPFLLERQFELIRELRVEAPALTLAMMKFSQAMRTPWPYLGLLVGVWLIWAGVRSQLGRPALYEMILRVPRIGPLLRNVLTARFARALSVQLEAGVPVTLALELAGKASANPLMSQAARRASQDLIEGQTLTVSLYRTGFFSRLFVSVMRAGEESGDVARMAGWLADLAEEELDRSLEMLESLLEPLIIGFIGIVVGVMVLATMLPLSQALGSI